MDLHILGTLITQTSSVATSLAEPTIPNVISAFDVSLSAGIGAILLAVISVFRRLAVYSIFDANASVIVTAVLTVVSAVATELYLGRSLFPALVNSLPVILSALAVFVAPQSPIRKSEPFFTVPKT